MRIFNQFKWTRRACYMGYITQAITVNFSPLLFLTFEKDFGVSLTQISLIISLNFAVQLLVDILLTKLISKCNLRATVVIAQFTATLGLVAMGVLPFVLPNPFAGLLIATFLCSIGGGCNEVLVSPIVEALPGDGKAASMSFLHSFYCWGQAGVILLAVGFFTLFGVANWPVMACLLALVPALGGGLFALVPLQRPAEEKGGTSIRELFRTKAFVWLLLMIFAGGAAELIMGQWASSFAEAGLKVSKSLGDLLGPCLFAVLMGTARLLYAKLAGKVSLLPVVTVSALLCILSYLLAALSPLPLLSLVGCALCGFSVGVFWPGSCSLAAEQIPHGGVPMFALLAIAGDIGCLLGPSAAGAIADRNGGNIRLSFLLALSLPLVILLAAARLFLLGKRKQKTE